MVNMARLRELCAERGVSIAELERRTDTGNGVIARWTVNIPRSNKLKAVADYLGVTMEELLTDETENAT